MWWLALPIAAAAAVMISVGLPSQENEKGVAANSSTQRQPTSIFKPVAVKNMLWSARDEGYVTLADGTQARRVRRSYVDTITWQNPATRASLKWTIPREDVRVVPVTFQ
jgi:hypothetical protein